MKPIKIYGLEQYPRTTGRQLAADAYDVAAYCQDDAVGVHFVELKRRTWQVTVQQRQIVVHVPEDVS